MSKVLVVYSTHEGQTAKIADVIAHALRDRGLDVTVADVKEAAGTISAAYDGVIVGGSIHMGKHDKRVVTYVKSNLDTLNGLPAAFFSVSLASQGDDEEAERYVEQFAERTGWRPGKVAMFSGALPYTRYNFITRHMMKKIVLDKPGSLGTDLSRDYVYTEWDGVKRFAEDFAEDLVPAS